MKTALYYTLRRHWGNLRPMAVTSEKPNRVFGRDAGTLDATHCLRRDCVGTFATEAEAKAAAFGIAAISEGHAKIISHLRDQVRTAEQRCTQEITRYAKENSTHV